MKEKEVLHLDLIKEVSALPSHVIELTLLFLLLHTYSLGGRELFLQFQGSIFISSWKTHMFNYTSNLLGQSLQIYNLILNH